MHSKEQSSQIFSFPVIGYFLRTIYTVARLPKLYDNLSRENSRLKNELSIFDKRVDDIQKEGKALVSSISSFQNVQENVQQRISMVEYANKVKEVGGEKTTNKKELFADDHLLDKFYTAFEDKFRGTEKVIIGRQKFYLPRFTNSDIDFSKTPVLDIGSGRGEFIQLLKNNTINVIGLDINHDMVKRSKAKGLQAIQGDALSHLRSAKSRSYGVITGFHIVEHIPFNVLLRIFTEAQRALVQDGFVLFETPNPENLIVGSTTFYMDPSHLHPVPPALLAFTLDFCGFRNVEIVRLHPDEELKKSGLTPDARELLYGPRDYAVIGYK